MHIDRNLLKVVIRPLLGAWVLIGMAIVPSLVGKAAQRQAPKPGAFGRRDAVAFRVSGVPRLDALFQLGLERRIPLGIECITQREMSDPLTLSLGPKPLSAILNAILSGAGGYFWRRDGGVINVSCSEARAVRGNPLNMVLRSISIPRCTMAEAGHYLEMAIHAQLYPGVGIAGNYNPGASTSLIGPVTLSDTTVQGVLNRLVSLGPKGVWCVRLPPRYVRGSAPTAVWEIVAYDDPAISSAPVRLRQGLAIYDKRASSK